MIGAAIASAHRRSVEEVSAELGSDAERGLSAELSHRLRSYLLIDLSCKSLKIGTDE